MKKLAIVLAIGATALLGSSAANAADNTVKARASTDAAQSTDVSSRHRRHVRHHRVHRSYYRPYYRNYGYAPSPYYRSYGYSPQPYFYGGGAPIVSFGFGGGGWRGGHHRHW